MQRFSGQRERKARAFAWFRLYPNGPAMPVYDFLAGRKPDPCSRVFAAMQAFEDFTTRLGHDLYFIEPLQYHNAIVFERYGFAYQQGRRWMESLNTRFSVDGDLLPKLDSSTPFGQPSAAQSIQGRSWAIQDAILGEPYTGVTMYKRVGQSAGVETFPGGRW